MRVVIYSVIDIKVRVPEKAIAKVNHRWKGVRDINVGGEVPISGPIYILYTFRNAA